MDPNAGHQLTVQIQCAVTVYALNIPLALFRVGTQNDTFNANVMTQIIRTNNIFTAVLHNQPVLLQSDTFFTVLLVKPAEADNTVFRHVRPINPLRSDWRVITVYAAGPPLKIATKRHDGAAWRQARLDTQRGVIHIRWIRFLEVMNEDEQDDADQLPGGDEPPPALPGPPLPQLTPPTGDEPPPTPPGSGAVSLSASTASSASSISATSSTSYEAEGREEFDISDIAASVYAIPDDQVPQAVDQIGALLAALRMRMSLVRQQKEEAKDTMEKEK